MHLPRLLYTLGAGLSKNKKGQIDPKIDLSNSVNPVGQLSNSFYEDLISLYTLGNMIANDLGLGYVPVLPLGA